MLNKSLVVAAIAATVATGTFSTQASAGDPVLGALIGGGIGAAIGHNINGPHGGWVGGALGAVTGASIAANSGGYYNRGYYGESNTYYQPAPAYYGPSVSYYEPAPVYYAPAPVYYGPPAVVYRSGPVYARSYYPRYGGYGRSYVYASGDWHDRGDRRDRWSHDRRGY